MPSTPPPGLNATAASILGFLHEIGPMTGFDLMAAIENIIGDFWHVTKSQIYRELKLLAENGFVETLASGPRDKQPYRLTSSGRQAFRDWIRQPATPPIMRVPIVLEVFFGGELPFEELRKHVEAMRAHHAKRLRAYEAFAPQAPPGTWIHESLRIGYM
ncbi:MAG TPA: PadR family transcriptional regulator, partial [Labilithrix sp.]|nr:PadR family transcriptional regulator [Labilithrix sp.]